MRRTLPLLAAVVFLLSAAAPVNAAEGAGGAAAIGMGLSVLGIGIGLGLIGYSALSGMARQPEQAGEIRTAMLIIGGLVEGAGILALILCLVTILVG
jgi:F0F1-type ATP synthase membrane subunit c/vacuolar-type H+-ATPase subunit K